MPLDPPFILARNLCDFKNCPSEVSSGVQFVRNNTDITHGKQIDIISSLYKCQGFLT